MNAAIALVFFACIAGSMAGNPTTNLIQQLIQQGQATAQGILSILQQQILAAAQGALGQISSLIGTIGRIDIQALLAPFASQIQGLLNGLLGQALQTITSLIGGGNAGRAGIDIGQIFQDFLAQITPAVTGLGQHFLNQGLSAVLGALGGIGGRADGGIGGIFSSLAAQISGLVSTAQSALTGAISNLTQIGAGILDAAKPHLSDLQDQLVGHGLNVLGSLSETINNLHGSITGGR